MKIIENYFEKWEKPLPDKDDHVGEESFIEWQYFNYPFFMPLIFFDKKKTFESRRYFVTLLEISFYLCILFYILFISAAVVDMMREKS